MYLAIINYLEYNILFFFIWINLGQYKKWHHGEWYLNNTGTIYQSVAMQLKYIDYILLYHFLCCSCTGPRVQDCIGMLDR